MDNSGRMLLSIEIMRKSKVKWFNCRINFLTKQLWTAKESSINFIFNDATLEDDFSMFRKIDLESVMAKYFNKLARPSGHI